MYSLTFVPFLFLLLFVQCVILEACSGVMHENDSIEYAYIRSCTLKALKEANNNNNNKERTYLVNSKRTQSDLD